MKVSLLAGILMGVYSIFESISCVLVREFSALDDEQSRLQGLGRILRFLLNYPPTRRPVGNLGKLDRISFV